MGLGNDFADMTAVTVTHEALSGFGGYGSRQFSTTSNSYDAVIDPVQRLVATKNGQTETAAGTLIILSSAATINLQDRLTWTGSTSARRILTVDPIYDEDGLHHTEVAYG